MSSDVVIEFVDPSMTGEYRITIDRTEKNALQHVPGGAPRQPEAQNSNRLDDIERTANLFKPPKTRFPDLEASVNSTVKFNLLRMTARADFFRALSNITLQFDKSDMQFKDKDGVSKAAVNLYARITSMSRRVVNVFEDVVVTESPTALLGQASKGSSIYQKSVPLAPGTYRLNVVAKDVGGGNMNVFEMSLVVPPFDDATLGASSLILADLIEKVPAKSIGAGQFVIRDLKVRPRLNATFRRDEKLGVYAEFYNFVPDEKTQKPSGSIEYEVVRSGSNRKVFEFSEDVSSLPGASASLVTIQKLLPLKDLEPGQYTLRLKVHDRSRGQTLAPSAPSTVN